jgi:glycosyltransferase involved in cell wall biosynthesis/ubiquinone/menaquinone biosynthesis C-methylase UbiE
MATSIPVSRLADAEAKSRSMNGQAMEVSPFLTACLLCQSRRLHYAFSYQGHRVVRCADCHLMLLNPQIHEVDQAAFLDTDYFLGDESAKGRAEISYMKRATAQSYLEQLERYCGVHNGRLLQIGCGEGDFLIEAQRAGYDVVGIEAKAGAAHVAKQRIGENIICASVDQIGLQDGSFDVCVLIDVLERISNPLALLQTARRLLKPHGSLFIVALSLDSWPARLFRQNWMGLKLEHQTYFDTNTIQHALYKTGFNQAVVKPVRKFLNLAYVERYFEHYPVRMLSPLVQILTQMVPRSLRSVNISVLTSSVAVFARPTPLPQRRTLSVVVPAYNEAATFEALMEALLRKEVPDLDLEIIIVESNSTDGTREIAQRYKDHSRVRLVLQDRPQGKGNAVRTGFQHATGDFILIQDADLEYDLEDYDALLEPLVQGRKAFVLGSRHGGNAWKMRRFANQLLLSTALNGGHWFFTTLVNVLFRQRLKDPFTMYKVFRRDCLYGLTFECNRFDFDYELLIKLVQKGYRPIEIPVNYRSRSFKEGKKVSVFRDPLTWLRALVKLRLSRIDPLRTVEEQRARQMADLNSQSSHEVSN